MANTRSITKKCIAVDKTQTAFCLQVQVKGCSYQHIKQGQEIFLPLCNLIIHFSSALRLGELQPVAAVENVAHFVDYHLFNGFARGF